MPKLKNRTLFKAAITITRTISMATGNKLKPAKHNIKKKSVESNENPDK